MMHFTRKPNFIARPETNKSKILSEFYSRRTLYTGFTEYPFPVSLAELIGVLE